jgi:hypothetical protein
VYRFVHVAELNGPALPDQFRSDREQGMTPFFRREKRYPELLDGMSVYASPEAALRRWTKCRDVAVARGEPIQIGSYVAEVELVPDRGFCVEDLGDDEGHLTIWGNPDLLAAATCRIYVPESDAE